MNHAIQEVVEKYSDPSADDGEEVSKCHGTILFYIVSNFSLISHVPTVYLLYTLLAIIDHHLKCIHKS